MNIAFTPVLSSRVDLKAPLYFSTPLEVMTPFSVMTPLNVTSQGCHFDRNREIDLGIFPHHLTTHAGCHFERSREAALADLRNFILLRTSHAGCHFERSREVHLGIFPHHLTTHAGCHFERSREAALADLRNYILLRPSHAGCHFERSREGALATLCNFTFFRTFGSFLHWILRSFLILFTLSITTPAFSQRNSEKGDRYFDQNQFEMAIKYYQMDIGSKDRKVSSYALQKMANCYRISGEFEKAEETFKKILKKKKKEPLNYLNYGLALKNSAKYAEAIVQFQEYVKLKPEDPMGTVFLLSCDSAQLWLDETIGKEVKNLEKLNTELSEFGPAFLNSEELYFSSSRQGSTKALISFDGGGDIHRLDLYTIKINEIDPKENKKTSLVNFRDINTPLHEGPACFSGDGKEIYFTKTIKGKRDKETNEILGTLQVFYSIKDSSGKWSIPKSAFSFNSQDYSVGHPSLSKDGQTIFYMSDKPGGFGKTDIYYSVRLADGIWSAPKNAGDKVNTFGHEMFPTLAISGDLYFASNAHPGMGQLDIFRASLTDGAWGNVHNLKPPINSIANDFGIVFDGEERRGIFSSDRFNGKGAEDLYSFSEDIPLRISLASNIIYFQDKSVYDDIKYKLFTESDSSQTDLVAENGFYCVKLVDKEKYILKVSKNGMPYNQVSLHYSLDSLSQDTKIDLRAKEKPVSLEGYFFPAKAVTPSSAQECSEISVYLEEQQEGVLHIYNNEKGYFKFDNTLEPLKTYKVRSTNYPRVKFVD